MSVLVWIKWFPIPGSIGNLYNYLYSHTSPGSLPITISIMLQILGYIFICENVFLVPKLSN